MTAKEAHEITSDLLTKETQPQYDLVMEKITAAITQRKFSALLPDDLHPFLITRLMGEGYEIDNEIEWIHWKYPK